MVKERLSIFFRVLETYAEISSFHHSTIVPWQLPFTIRLADDIFVHKNIAQIYVFENMATILQEILSFQTVHNHGSK